MTQKERYNGIIKIFSKTMPDAKSELTYDNPYQLLVAVILSAQCTDKRVNMTTPAFFKRFPDPETLSKAEPEEVSSIIKSISYPNNKAKSLIGMAKKVTNDFKAQIPDTMDKLLTLPGVGRKTASVVLICAFNKPAMPVDTHVFRVSNRIGLTKNSPNPQTTEKILIKNFPEALLPVAHHWLILHGRYTCRARKPLCDRCKISNFCEYFQNTEN